MSDHRFVSWAVPLWWKSPTTLTTMLLLGPDGASRGPAATLLAPAQQVLAPPSKGGSRGGMSSVAGAAVPTRSPSTQRQSCQMSICWPTRTQDDQRVICGTQGRGGEEQRLVEAEAKRCTSSARTQHKVSVRLAALWQADPVLLLSEPRCRSDIVFSALKTEQRSFLPGGCFCASHRSRNTDT